MPVHTTDDPESAEQTQVIATVRVPNRADGDLALEAERRLTATDTVTELAVEGLRGVEPRLSATMVTLEVTIHTADSVVPAELREALAAGTGVEEVTVTAAVAAVE